MVFDLLNAGNLSYRDGWSVSVLLIAVGGGVACIRGNSLVAVNRPILQYAPE